MMSIGRSAQAGGVRVLIVDDESLFRAVLLDALRLMGYQVEEAASGSEALEKLADGIWDLMLLDLVMPGTDSVDLMRRIRSLYPELPVIILTAYGTLKSAIGALQTGMADYLLKPCSIRDIEAAIVRVVKDSREGIIVEPSARRTAVPAELPQPNREPTGLPTLARSERFVQCGGIVLDQQTRGVSIKISNSTYDLVSELTPSEAAVLRCLMRHANTVVSHRHLAWEALNYDLTAIEAQTILRPHISRLRKKLETDPNNPNLIRTIRGQGYLFSPPEQTP